MLFLKKNTFFISLLLVSWNDFDVSKVTWFVHCSTSMYCSIPTERSPPNVDLLSLRAFKTTFSIDLNERSSLMSYFIENILTCFLTPGFFCFKCWAFWLRKTRLANTYLSFVYRFVASV